MYSGRGFRDWEIGDIDIIRHNGLYHLFHLVLPNHDYIAHATSVDCINWSRVKNALFVGDPGEWDDDMLWTMHVTQNDHGFDMFYTGLSQKEHGFYQRIGKAKSEDMFVWHKEQTPPFPIEPEAPHYETKVDNARQWVSFRDPYFFICEDGKKYLLVCARTKSGPISRRGCVGVIRLEGEKAICEKPLFIPYVYDDIECPSIVKINGFYYLIGSIREDVKVHYWYSKTFQGDYQSFTDNVLMPQGNYAARVTWDGDRILLYSFYVSGSDVETSHRYFCPPKELDTDESGRLFLKSFYNWKHKASVKISQRKFEKFHALLNNPTATFAHNPGTFEFGSKSGYETFCLKNPFPDFIWRGRIKVLGLGKFGLIFNANHDADGYYISIDPIHNLVQIRSWSKHPENIYKDYLFENLQANMFRSSKHLDYEFELLRYGHYIEFSMEDRVKLSLINSHFQGELLGVYCESSRMELSESELIKLEDSQQNELAQPFEGIVEG